MEAASCRSAAGKAARVGLLQAEQPKVNMVLQAGAAVVDCITAGGAVEVNYGAAGRQQNIGKLRAEQ